MKATFKLFILVSLILLKTNLSFAGVPSEPTALSANAGNNKVKLAWVASTGTATIFYTVRRSLTPGTGFVNIASNLLSTSYIDTTAINNTAYFYEIKARNKSGSSSPSSMVKAIPIAPPSAPSSLSATTTSDNKIALTWIASNGNGNISYIVSRSLSSGVGYAPITTTNLLSYKDTDVELGTKYFYVVQAINNGGTSSNSNESKLVAGRITPPASPTSLVSTVVNNKQIELSWKASLAGGVVNYSVLRSLTKGSGYVPVINNLSTPNFIDKTVSKGNKYYYVISATNDSGTSAPSNESTIFVSSAKVLFKTSFGPGLSLNSPSGVVASQAWQTFSGTDTETGYSFPVAGLGSDQSLLQLLGPYTGGGTALTTDNVDLFFGNRIKSVIGPKGKPVNELYQNLKIKEESVGVAGSQDPLMIQRPWNIGDTGDVYISYWYKLPNDLPSKLYEFVPAGNWRMFFEFKTGGWDDSFKGDFRMRTTIMKGKDGSLHWKNGWDNNANLSSSDIPGWTDTTYWEEFNYTAPVPLGVWFKFEVFWHRSKGADGYYWTAINGQKIAEHTGPNIGDLNLPITRIMVNNAYTGGAGPIEGHLTDLQIWNGFPCGVEISCP